MLEDIIKKYNKKYIMGIDEVGMGCLSGPAYACGFKAPSEWVMKGIKDSKKMTAKSREKAVAAIREDQSIYGYNIVQAPIYDIDTFNIQGAIHIAYFNIVMELGVTDTLIIVDGNMFKENRYEYVALVKGDNIVPHVSAASVIAKVTRDLYMKELHELYPEYNWAKNSGYGSPEHLAAIKKFGPTPHHRRSFDPVKTMLLEKVKYELPSLSKTGEKEE